MAIEMPRKKNKRNVAKCLECQTVIESTVRHEFVSCACQAIFVDGGPTYNRFGWTEGKRYIRYE